MKHLPTKRRADALYEMAAQRAPKIAADLGLTAESAKYAARVGFENGYRQAMRDVRHLIVTADPTRCLAHNYEIIAKWSGPLK